MPVKQPFRPRDVDKSVASAMVSGRKQLGLSQEAAAKATGISFATYRRYEALQSAVTIQDLQRIEELLGPCLPSRVVSAAQQATEPSTMTGLERKALNLFRELSEDAQRRVLGVMVELLPEPSDPGPGRPASDKPKDDKPLR